MGLKSPKRVVKTMSRPHCRFSFSGSMMKRMSFSETIFLFVLALIIFGPKKLPEIARQVGKYMNEFKRASNEFKAQIEQEISHLEIENRQTVLPPAPPPQGATSRTLYTASPPISGADGSAAQVGAPDAHATEAPEVKVPVVESPAAPAAPVAPAASDDEPLFATNAATGSAVGAGAVAPSPVTSPVVPPSDEVTLPTTQESHV
jgi:sec-independent protein translocase protein TatB